MAGITLATAQSELDRWISLQSEVTPERSISVDDGNGGQMVVTYHDLDRIERMIDFWDRKVRMLSRGSGVGVSRMVVND